jgi:hypothetical protein
MGLSWAALVRGLDSVNDELADRVSAVKPQLRVRLIAAFLLISTFALALHIQIAKNHRQYLFHTKHVLHEDLRADSEKPAETCVQLCSSSVHAGFVALVIVHSSFRWPIFSSIEPACDFSLVRLTRYFARFFRAPPMR